MRSPAFNCLLLSLALLAVWPTSARAQGTEVDRLVALSRLMNREEFEDWVEGQTRGADFRIFVHVPYEYTGLVTTHKLASGEDAEFRMARLQFAGVFNLVGVRGKELALRHVLESDPLRVYLGVVGDFCWFSIPEEMGEGGLRFWSLSGALTVKWRDWIYARGQYTRVQGEDASQDRGKVHLGIPRWELYVGVGIDSGGASWEEGEGLGFDRTVLGWRIYADLFAPEKTAREYRWIGIHDITLGQELVSTSALGTAGTPGAKPQRAFLLRYRLEDFLGYVNAAVDLRQGDGFGSLSFSGTLSLLSVTRWLLSVPLDAPSKGLFPMYLLGFQTFGTQETRVPSLQGRAGYNIQVYGGGGGYWRQGGSLLPTVHGGVRFRWFSGSPDRAMEVYGLDVRGEYNPPSRMDESPLYDQSLVLWVLGHMQF